MKKSKKPSVVDLIGSQVVIGTISQAFPNSSTISNKYSQGLENYAGTYYPTAGKLKGTSMVLKQLKKVKINNKSKRIL